MLFVLCNLMLRAEGVGKIRFAHCKRICEAESGSRNITSCIDAMALLSQLRPSLRAARRQGSCPACTQGGPKVTLVDLNRATSGASPEECEDELSSLLAGLEYMVSRTAAAATAPQGDLRDARLRWRGGAVSGDGAMLVVDLRRGRGGRRAWGDTWTRPPRRKAAAAPPAATPPSVPPCRCGLRGVQPPAAAPVPGNFGSISAAWCCCFSPTRTAEAPWQLLDSLQLPFPA